MKKIAAVAVMVLAAGLAQAAGRNDKSCLEVNLNRPLPSYDELAEKYAATPIYDRRYEFSWNIGKVFDKVFAQTIKTYGSGDKRLKKENEEALLELIQSAPPEIYPYIGPYLHTVPNMSPKILNMPGIKETKGRFPQRIAPQMAEIPNLEFLSPHLYFLLIPEVWPDNVRAVEPLKTPAYYPQTVYNAEFYRRLKQLVPPESFQPGAERKKALDISDLRTVSPDEKSPLTSADVQAFARTIPAVNKLASAEGMALKLFAAGQLLDKYESEQNGCTVINTLKDLVYPCRRLVQKMRILGMETDLKLAVGGEAFNLDEWAYICDKTVKAYRASTMSASTAAAIKNLQDGIYERDLAAFPENLRYSQFQASRATVLMYEAPLPDVLEVIKNRRMLRREFAAGKYLLGGQPLSLSQ